MFTDRLDDLRERNKHLLKKLRQHKEKLEQLNGCNENRKRGREHEDEERRQPEVMVTLTDGDRRPAKAALARSSVRFADVCETNWNETRRNDTRKSIQHTTSTSYETSKHTRLATEDSHRNIQVHNRLQGIEPFSATSCPLRHSKDQREVQSRVTFQSDECEDIPVSERHRLQPLLGYDWIAGVLDSEDLLVDRSDEFFNDLRVFRSLYKDECVRNSQPKFSEESHLLPPLLKDKDDPEANVDTHQCTFSYRINSRLFPVPLHSQECCPVCKRKKSSHPHTAAEPALIRVSIPRTTLLPSYEYKAHRRCSFDPSDSLGLPSHCLSGWSNKGQTTVPPPCSLDLRSSLQMKNSDELLNKELEELSGPKGSEGQLLDRMSDVSRLARHNFQHFPKK
ncbi:migration and invasion-inhibitory protein [Melanotaenia boesemani]|uniref:migration and invasion-inhibitory protein n=1 Tax=Melanotaenia boesemani TaxID=1250792 RepID=UPI001C041CD8|nr:migration and invasion-inhibitory protein [Melanotaenia boesemani]